MRRGEVVNGEQKAPEVTYAGEEVEEGRQAAGYGEKIGEGIMVTICKSFKINEVFFLYE